MNEINKLATQLLHNVEDKPTDFVAKVVKRLEGKKNNKLATQPSLYGRSGTINLCKYHKIKSTLADTVLQGWQSHSHARCGHLKT
jgi:hypothetical protein